MGAHMRISSATAPLNNAFFLDRGLLEKAGKGAYKPTKIALDFQRKWTFDKAAAPAILAPAMQKDSWFYNAVVEKLEIGPTTRETMIDVLSSLAETDAAYATQYGFLLEWLADAGLITMEDGNIAVADGVTPAQPAEAPTTSTPSTNRPSEAITAEPLVQTAVPPATAPAPTTSREAAVVSISIDVQATASDLAKLTGEQIASLFAGVGQIAAIKAALEVG